MSFTLPELEYSYDALVPFIDAQTMELHHSKHHAGYVDKLNAALDGREDLLNMSVEELLKNIDKLPDEKKQIVINNAGGHANHSLFWKILSKDSSKSPEGELLKKINETFGSFENFKTQFSEKALSVFGSGWVFLIIDEQNNLKIKRHSFQNSPIMNRHKPILALDLWEHAYYLKYQNRRAEYIDAFWNIINWNQVLKNFEG